MFISLKLSGNVDPAVSCAVGCDNEPSTRSGRCCVDATPAAPPARKATATIAPTTATARPNPATRETEVMMQEPSTDRIAHRAQREGSVPQDPIHGAQRPLRAQLPGRFRLGELEGRRGEGGAPSGRPSLVSTELLT